MIIAISNEVVNLTCENILSISKLSERTSFKVNCNSFTFCAFMTCVCAVFMISPVECDRRVGLCRAVEFHKVALQNRLRLH